MTNKTKAAIEEAAKLPTARELIAKIVPNQANFEYCGRYRTINGSLLIDIEKTIESHTAAHTAALRERVKVLETSIDLLHMEIHVLITNARVSLTKLRIDPDKSEAADRLFYDLDVGQGKLMDSIGDKIKSILK